MTPKEKAQELFDKYYQLVSYPTPNWRNVTKQCALIAIDEMLEEIKDSADKEIVVLRIIYWEKVKQEIEKL
jgi:hypothetical protein